MVYRCTLQKVLKNIIYTSHNTLASHNFLFCDKKIIERQLQINMFFYFLLFSSEEMYNYSSKKVRVSMFKVYNKSVFINFLQKPFGQKTYNQIKFNKMQSIASPEILQQESTNQLDQLLVNLIERKQPPNIDVALLNKRKKSVKQNVKMKQQNDGYQWSQFGPGVMLYFRLLKYLTIFFIILFINALPSLIYNYTNKGLDIYHENSVSHFKIELMRFSLANLPISSFSVNKNEQFLKSKKMFQDDTEQIISHSQTSRFIVCLNDFWITLLCVCFFIYWEIKARQMVESKQIKNCDLPSYRTIVVYDLFQSNSEPSKEILPYPLETNSQLEKQTQRNFSHSENNQNIHVLTTQEKWELKIKQHFQKFAQVDSVTIVYDYGQTLQQLTDFNGLVKKYSEQSNENKKSQLYEFLKIKFQIIKSEYLKITQNNMKNYEIPFLPKKAFVTFYTKQDRNRVKNLYKYKINPKLLQFSLFKSRTTEITNNQSLPRVKKCHTQPVSIKWENFHHKRGQEVRSTFFIGGFLCVVLFFALIAILLLSMKMAGLVDKTWHLQPQSAPNSNDPLIQHPTFQQASRTTNLQTLYNFCSSLQLSYTSFRLEYYTLCQEYFSNFSQKWLTMWMISGIIVTINLLLNFIISSLVDFRRHRTSTERSRFLIINIFLVYFSNMVLILMLIRADFSPNATTEQSLVHFIKSILPEFQSHKKVETYPQFNRKWYIHIGNQLTFNYIVSLIISPWFYVLMYWFFDKVRFLVIKFQRFRKNQSQINQILLSQQFDFQTYYAMAICSFYFALTIAAAMPIFYLLAALSFLSLYLSTRVIFYNFCRVPQLFDHSINTLVSKVLMFGLGVHQIATIFFVYAEDIFPSLQQIGLSHKRTTSLTYKLKQGWVYLCMFVLIMIVYWFKKEIATMVKKKFYQSGKLKELNEEQMMKEIDVNFHENGLVQEMQAGQIMANSQQKDQIDSNNIQKERMSSQKQVQMSPSPSFRNIQSQLLHRYYYRMQDNPLYSNIYYTLTVFHKIVYNTEFGSNPKIQLPQDKSDMDKDDNKLVQ